jgi:hypothetical protein
MQQTAKVTDMPNLPEGASAEYLLEEFRGLASCFAESLQQWRAIRQVAKITTASMFNKVL